MADARTNPRIRRVQALATTQQRQFGLVSAAGAGPATEASSAETLLAIDRALKLGRRLAQHCAAHRWPHLVRG